MLLITKGLNQSYILPLNPQTKQIQHVLAVMSNVLAFFLGQGGFQVLVHLWIFMGGQFHISFVSHVSEHLYLLITYENFFKFCTVVSWAYLTVTEPFCWVKDSKILAQMG